jgi:hypothetical protein
LNSVDDAIDKNAELAMEIFEYGIGMFESSPPIEPVHVKGEPWFETATAADMDKARSTIRQFYRDWSAEGAIERDACYNPVIADLEAERARINDPDRPVNVLVPGAGLGRLVFELALEGFNAEGNEISYHQLLASSYILNFCPRPGAHTIYPWVHTFSNLKSRSRQFVSYLVPDIHPGMALGAKSKEKDARQPGEMNMTAADFICLYSDKEHKDTFDAVATVFFIDTAPNVLRYIETIRNCLKTGGIWTNLGPLLWHFENNSPNNFGKDDEDKRAKSGKSNGIADAGNFELAEDELLQLIEHSGFTIESYETGIETGYIQDEESMIQNKYKVSHWIARKRE